MIQSKLPLLAVALGAAATFGFVWLGRRPRRNLAARSPTPLPEFGSDEAARADAIRDLDFAPLEETDLDIFDVSEVEEIEPNTLEGVELVAFDEEPSVNEPYDAVDPESIGTEFLRRATESYVPSGNSASLPIAIDSEDIAVELPVGRLESDGSTELHAPEHPTGRVTDLSPNDEELAQRAAEAEPPASGEKERDGTSKPHG